MVAIFRIALGLILLALLGGFPSAYANQPSCELTLVYKAKGKAGYMAKAPSNEGLYKALYSELAAKFDCQLRILRAPKKRTLALVKQGKADLYPSTGFDWDRSAFMFYTPNGLYRYEDYYGLAPVNVRNLRRISQISNYGLAWIFEAGNTTKKLAEALGVESKEIVSLTDDRAIKMLKNGRPVFYRIIKSDYERYLRDNNLKSLRDLGISTHVDCCEPKSQKLYMGISRNSPHYQAVTNTSYDPLSPLSVDNFPVKLDPNSMAYKIALELEKLDQSGRVKELYNQYIVEPQ